MLDAKDILQIDATIIAGIFIFLTIGSIGQHPSVAQVVNEWAKTSDELDGQLVGNQTKLHQLALGLDNVTIGQNQIQSQIDEINKKPQEIQAKINEIDLTINGLTRNMTSAKSTEQNEIKAQIERLSITKQQFVKELSTAEQKIGLNELQDNFTKTEQRKKELKSQINQTNDNIQSLKKKTADVNEKFKADLNTSGSSFLKKPEDWVYGVGIPIGGSAILALMSDFWGRHEKIKSAEGFTISLSLILMGVGFVYLTVIFFVIGGGPCYVSHNFC